MASAEPTSPESGRYSRRHQAAAQLVHSLDVFLKQGLRLYSEGHPIVERYRETLTRQVASFLAEGPALFQVGPFELLFEDVRIHRDPEIVPENFVLRLYRDGVRDFCLLPELRPEELFLFCRTLATDPGMLAFMGESLATSLFNADLTSIRFTLVPPVLLAGRMSSLSPSAVAAMDDARDYATEGLDTAVARLAPSVEEDRQIVARELAVETEGEVRRLVGILIDILLSNEVEEERRQVRATFASMLETLLVQEQIEVVVNALERLREAASSDGPAADELAHATRRLSASPVLSMLAERDGKEGSPGDDLVRLFSFLGSDAAPAALALFARVRSMSQLEALQRCVARMATVPEVVATLDEARQRRDGLAQAGCLEVLGRMHSLVSRRAIADIVLDRGHPMRLRAVELLLDRYSADLEAPLSELMDDPDLRVRMSVTEGMLRADPAAAKLRITMALERRLAGDEPDDLGRELAQHYLELDRSGCVVFLLARLGDRKSAPALRIVAAEMLGRVKDRERIRQALEKERDRFFNPRTLKTACEKALAEKALAEKAPGP